MTAADRPSSAADPEAVARPTTAGGDAVRVAVRARPLVPHERAARAKEAVRVAGDTKSVVVGADRVFAFDVAFGTAASQVEVYDDCVAPLVESCFAGEEAQQTTARRARCSNTLPLQVNARTLPAAATPVASAATACAPATWMVYPTRGQPAAWPLNRRGGASHGSGAASPPTLWNCARIAPSPSPLCPPTGYNATLLAYGQTGSGKTHTMGTASTEGQLDGEWGMIPRAIRHLYRLKDERGASVETTIRCAFLEILNEEVRVRSRGLWVLRASERADCLLPSSQVRDLLHPDTPSKNISIRERADGAILVSGIYEEPCPQAEDLERALDRGALCRATGATRMNAASSRSHAIFTIIVEQRRLSPGPGECPYVNAKFHLVDLAGSERNKKTDATGQRFREAVHINSGLLVLGNVINALAERDHKSSRGRTHVPYRDSKLTRLLQDSLGGNAKTCMVACVSTADSSLEETVNTLKYAERARAIRNRPHVNVDPQAAALAAAARGDDSMDPYGGPSVLAARAAQSAAEQRESEARALAEQGLAQVARLKAELAAARSALATAEEAAKQLRGERDAARVELASALSSGRVSTTGGGGGDPSAAGAPESPSTRMPRTSVVNAMQKLSDVESRLAAKEAALQTCEALLAEAQGDLARDEVIFREKLAEAKQLKKALREALAHVDEAKSRAAAAEAAAAAAELRAASLSSASHPASGSDVACPSCGAAVLLGTATAGGGEEEITRRASVVSSRSAAGLNGGSASAGDVESLEKALAEKEAERSAMVAAKSRAEAAKLLAEADAEREAQEFARSRQAMERQLREMEFAISRKEELIADLARNEEAARQLSTRYEQRMKDMEAAVADRELEAERLRAQLEALDAAATKASVTESAEAEAARVARAAAEAQLAAANAQLATLRDAQKASAGEAHVALRQQHKTSESKTEALASELQRMRTAQEQLRRKLASSAEHHAAESAAQARDMAALKKEADASAKRVKDLEAENARQRAVLQKRAEDVLSAQRRLRGSAATGTGMAPASAPMEPAWWPGVAAAPGGPAPSPPPQQRGAAPAPVPAPVPQTGSAVGSPQRVARVGAARRVSEVTAAPGAVHSAVPPGGEWLSLELSALLRLREAQEDATAAASKRASVAAEREAVAADKAALELRRARAAATLDASLAAAGIAIAEAEAHAASLGPSASPAEVSAARDGVEDAYRQRAALDARKRGGIATLLSPGDAALAEQLDDRLDALETQESYLVAAEAEAAREAEAAAAGAAAFHAKATSLGPDEARAALQQAADAAVAAATSARRDAQRAASAEAQLAERERELTDTTAALARREMDYDRRVVELQKEHARKVQLLLQQAAAVGAMGNGSDRKPAAVGDAASQMQSDAAAFREEQLRASERDARYHKTAAQELKKQLAEAQAGLADVEAERDLTAVKRDEAEAMVMTLMEELAHAKDALRALGRVSIAGGLPPPSTPSPQPPQGDVPLPPPPPWMVPGDGGPVRVMPRVSQSGESVTRVLPPRVSTSGAGLPPRHPA